MTILIAMDKFKASLTAGEACNAVKTGIYKAAKDINTIIHPVADGGEGSLEAISEDIKAKRIDMCVNGPCGKKVPAYYLLNKDKAYIELALASGLQLVPGNKRNPLYTTTTGTGMLISDAIKRGAKDIFLFVGGSATNDAGIGILKALGFNFLDKNGKELYPSGNKLIKIHHIDSTGNTVPQSIKFHILTDVLNPLYGDQGAAYIYASQKGASASEISLLDKGLQHFSALVKNKYKRDIANAKGSGAAGGVAAGLSAFFDVEIKSGIKEILKITGFEKKLKNVDIVITGEGKVDNQSLSGKAISEILLLARKYNIKPVLFAGIINEDIIAKLDVFYYDSIIKHAKSHDDAIDNARFWLEKMSIEFIQKTTEPLIRQDITKQKL